MKKFFFDERGTGMVEFAMITPILLVIYSGIYEFWNMLEIKQKVIELTRYYSWEMAFRHPQTGENWGSQESQIKKEMERELVPFKAVDAKLETGQTFCSYERASEDAFLPVVEKLVRWMCEGFSIDPIGQVMGLGLPMSNDKMTCQVQVSYTPRSFGFILNTTDTVNWHPGDRVVLGGDKNYSRSSILLFNWKAEPVDRRYHYYVQERIFGIWCGGVLNNKYLRKLLRFISDIPVIGAPLRPINDFLLKPQVFLDYLD